MQEELLYFYRKKGTVLWIETSFDSFNSLKKPEFKGSFDFKTEVAPAPTPNALVSDDNLATKKKNKVPE